jgi:hypothetical protein
MRAEEFITEHRMVWKSTKKGLKLKWRCTSGFRTGRTVPNAKDCSKPLDIAQAQRMKKTRARTKISQARKSKKTKRVNPGSRLAAKLNKSKKRKSKKRR